MKESNTHSAITETPTGVTPGVLLKTARQEQGLSVVDVAARLCLGIPAIEAIERDDYSRMAAKVYARGHVISYSRILGIPETKILSALANVRMEFEPVKTIVAMDNEKSIPICQPIETSQPRSSMMLWGSILVLVILIGLVMMWWRGPSTPQSKPNPVATTPVSTTAVSLQPQQQLPVAPAPAAPASTVPMVKSYPAVPGPLPAPARTQADPANKNVLQPSEFRDPKKPLPSSTATNSESSADLPPPRASDRHP